MPRLELDKDEMVLILNAIQLASGKMSEKDEVVAGNLVFMLGDLIQDEEAEEYAEQKMEDEYAKECEREAQWIADNC